MFVSKKRLAGLALILAFSFVNCVGGLTPKTSGQYPNSVTPAAQAAFAAAELSYEHHEYPQAFTAYTQFLATYPGTKLADEAAYKLGKIHFINGEYPKARDSFELLAKSSPDAAYTAKGWHMAGYSAYKAGDQAGAVADLHKVEPSALPEKVQLQYYSLVILCGDQIPTEHDFADYGAVHLQALYDDSGNDLRSVSAVDVLSSTAAQTRFNTWLSTPLADGKIPLWMKRFPKGSERAAVDYKIAKTYAETGKSDKARVLLTDFLQNYPRSDLSGSASKLLADLGGAVQTGGQKPYRLGVLLPAAGFDVGGQNLLEGIRCAAGVGGACGGVGGVEILVKNVALSSDGVHQALTELSQSDVAAVISLLPGNIGVEAANAATEKHVPFLPISYQSGLMKQGAYVFQVGLPPEQQVSELVREARRRGLKRFAIFYPNIAYGEKMASLFRSEVAGQSGKVVTSVSYDKGSADIFAETRKLVVTTGTAESAAQVGAAPVGFDAIFIPDSFQAVNAIVRGLSFNNISNVALLGTNTWNDSMLSSTIAASYPLSFFVDIYSGVSNGDAQAFRDKFNATYKKTPGVLQALGYDAMMIVRDAVSKNGAKHVYEVLSSDYGYRGVTGLRGFRSGEGPVVQAQIINIK